MYTYLIDNGFGHEFEMQADTFEQAAVRALVSLGYHIEQVQQPELIDAAP